MKKINLIEWLWKTDSHEKQKVRGVQKYCILLLLLFTCVAHAYAKVVYYNDNGQSGTPKVYFWGGDNPCSNWDDSRTMTNVTGNIYYYDIGNNTKCIFRYNNASSQTGDLTVPGNDANYMATYNANSSTAWSTYQVTSTASLSATTPIGIGVNSTITPSLTSNTSQNEIKSTTYSVTTNPGSAGSVTSGGVFSATAAGTYTVTATITYNPKGSSGITKTVKPTKTIVVEDYIYFYAAIPNGWDNRTTTVRLTSSGSSALTPYDNTSLASTTKNASSPCVPVYSAVSSTSYYNSGAKYNVYIYKVLESDAGKNVYLGHSEWTFGTAIGTVAAGKLYTLTSGDNGGTYMTANAISVNSVTASGPYAINAVSLTSSISAYGTSTANLRTAGGDTFTTTYTLNDVTASTSTVITPSVSNTYTSNTGNLVGTITIDEGDLTAGHTYTLTVKVADNITGKMTSSATSSSFAVTAASTATLTYHENFRTETGNGTGSAPDAEEYDINGTATVAGQNSMLWSYYTFIGWNTDEHITGDHYDEGDEFEITEDMDLYATWKRSIPMDDQDATTGVSTTVYGTYNSTALTTHTNPAKDDYTFGGWWTQIAGGGNYVISPEHVLQASKTNWTDANGQFIRPSTSTSSLYAKWTQSVTLKANTSNHGSGDDQTATATWNSTSITIPTHCSAASGYSLDGYYTAATDGTKIINANKSFAGTNITNYITSGKWKKEGATTLWAQFTPNNYTIELNDNGGSGGDGTHAVTFDAATGSLTNAPERDGYTFAGYWTGSGGTGTQIFNADLTPIQNVSGYTDNTSDKKWIYAGNKTLYAKWTEIKYTVTLVNATASSVSAGCATHPSITASTAPFGMKFDHWDVSGGASVASTTSNPTTVSATAAGTVTAVYTQGLYAFIEGRFHVADASTHSSWTNTFDDGDWNQNSTKIQFAYDESSHIFYLHTYATANALTTQISSHNPVFFIKTSTSPSSLTGVTEYKMSTANTQITDKGASNGATFNSHATGDTDNGNLRINSSDVSALVTLYFDGTKVWYDYSPAIINTVSLSGTRVPPGASITATPSMYYKGNTNKAYCWGVYTDAACTSQVTSVSFNSLGAGKVQFTVPQAQNTYYLKLTVRASDACEASIEDEDVQSFRVTTNPLVFFNNTATKWSNVYVYFLGKNSYWDNTYGAGCKNRDGGQANQMHRIGKSDIYYFDYTGHTTDFNLEDTVYVAFTEIGKPDADKFYYVKAAYRGDFSECAPMYVPTNAITISKNSCDYNNTGYWTNYGVSGVARDAGFTLKVFDGYDGGTELASETLSNTDGSNTYRATVNLTRTNHKHGFQLLSCGHLYYGNNGTMTADKSTGWDQEVDKHRCGLESMAAGAYTFIVQCTDEGNLKVSVEYPLMNGDYRLMYNDTCVYQAHAHPSQFIRRKATKLDTVSMYIRPDKQPVLKIQVCDNASSNPPVWRDSVTYDVSGLTNGHRVYNFYISQADGKLTINDVRPYTGLYYVRTQQLDGGWYNYESNSDNVMTYTEYAEQKNYGFNYYKAKWVGTTGADVTFTIANDYSESLCDTMVADPENNPLTAAQARSLPHTASVRFGWNSKTNTLHRAYINGSSVVSDRYLVLIGDEKLKDKDGNPLTTAGGGKVSGLDDYEMNFTDLNNWIYRCDVTAVEGAEVKLTAKYDSYTQYFIGGADASEQIIGSTGSPEPEEYVMRVTYDFKTNRLMTAWLPNGSQITSNVELNADMMLIRKGQNAATQVYFNGNKKSISEIHTIFGVMEFQYDSIVGKFPSWSSTNAYKYLMYYISFPFDVKVSEIFGCGVRGENWIIQKYNGAKRAKIGWFAETSTFWETLPGDSTLHAYEGYLLLLDRISFNDGGSKIWENLKSGGSVYLYFPSASKTSGTISDGDKVVTVPAHECTIDRTFTPAGAGGPISHQYTDSHWNVIGTPLFENKTAASIVDGPEYDEDPLQYYYAWNSADNTLAAQAAFDDGVTFKSMHSYMVQYTGDVTFSGAKLTPPPASVAARHIPSEKQNYRIKLRMETENGNRSETFVELRENACDTFALNEDMYMMRSSTTVDLYTYAGNYDVAANVLSMNNHIVPVGMDVKRAGTYRFTMPSEFSGTVTLIDAEADVRTNLAYGDYEVNLPKGTSNNRFLLEINIHQMPTSIDGVGGSLKDGKAHKFIENGQMYILQNGAIYDARGNRVR